MSSASYRPNVGPPARQSSRRRGRPPQKPVPTHLTSVSSLSGGKLTLFAAGLFCLGSISLLPLIILETLDMGASGSGMHMNMPVSVEKLVHMAQQKRAEFTHRDSTQKLPDALPTAKVPAKYSKTKSGPVVVPAKKGSTAKKHKVETTRKVPIYTLADLAEDKEVHDKPVARGLSGRPLSETPSAIGAKRAHVQGCEVNVDSLAYWNDPQGQRDQDFVSPYADMQQEKYISFAPDRGGWNNVRMSMEIIFVIAAATGRTLVLPPKEPLYLLHHDTTSKYRGFADFFPLHTAEFQKRVKTIEFVDFVKKEGQPNGRLPVPANLTSKIDAVLDHCDKRAQSHAACAPVFEYLSTVGQTVDVGASRSCIVFDQFAFRGEEEFMTSESKAQVDVKCGSKREKFYWDSKLQENTLVHFMASDKAYRLLTHFYGMVHFSDPAEDHHFKRFVRDFLHYHDSIYCAAGKIVKAVQAEGLQRGFKVDEEGGGGFSALHVRRGDLQYKKVKIPAQEWYDNTKEVWLPNEILYIATDERDKSFFGDLAAHHDLRFLDDYWDFAGLGDLDPNYMGMIDTIVASRGRAFAGTWFSTFSGYINRLRGYHGMTMQNSWYGFLPKKTAVHEWKIVDGFAYAFEWPDGWMGIDADEWPKHDVF